MKMIRFAALALPALLLAGCAANPLTMLGPTENTATVETAAAPAAQTLNVYATDALLPALQAYADAQQVALNRTDDPAAADLAALDHTPGDLVDGLDVAGDTLLAAAASRAGITGSADALPLGRSLYGYWVNGTVVTSLLGGKRPDRPAERQLGRVERLCGDAAGLAGRARGGHCDAVGQRLHPARDQARHAACHGGLFRAHGPGGRLHGGHAGGGQ